MNVRKILVAVDFSAHSDKAVEDGIDLAKRFDAELHLVHAFDVPVPMVTPYEVAVPTGFVEQAREAAKKRLQELEEKVRAAGSDVHAHLTEAPAAHAVARAAEELGVDLIVMGTRGNTGLKHVILGSVAERTLRLAPCSVLTVKTADD
ncbi:MAG: universal stress protein [Myxococcota bacterium]